MIGTLLLLVKWELGEFARSKVLLFWNLLFPLLLFIVLAAAFGGRATLGTVPIALIDQDKTVSSGEYRDTLRSVFQSNDGVLARFVKAERGNPDVVVTIPAGYEASLRIGRPIAIPMQLNAPTDAAARTATEIVRSVTNELELRAQGGGGVRLGVTAAAGRADMPYMPFLATGIVILTLLSVCTIGIVIPLAARREYGVLRGFQILALAPATYLTAFVVSRILLSLLLSGLFVLILTPFYELGLSRTPGAIAEAVALLIVLATVFSLFGLALASRVRSVASATAIANLVFFPLVFLSGLTIPTRNFPPILQNLSALSPSAQGVAAIRSMIVVDAPAGAMGWSLVVILAWGLLALISARVLFVWAND